MQALHDVVQAGYVRYIGMSSCHAYQCESCSRLDFRVVLISGQSMLCRVRTAVALLEYFTLT